MGSVRCLQTVFLAVKIPFRRDIGLLDIFFLVGRHMTMVVGWFVVRGTFFLFSLIPLKFVLVI